MGGQTAAETRNVLLSMMCKRDGRSTTLSGGKGKLWAIRRKEEKCKKGNESSDDFFSFAVLEEEKSRAAKDFSVQDKAIAPGERRDFLGMTVTVCSVREW